MSAISAIVFITVILQSWNVEGFRFAHLNFRHFDASLSSRLCDQEEQGGCSGFHLCRRAVVHNCTTDEDGPALLTSQIEDSGSRGLEMKKRAFARSVRISGCTADMEPSSFARSKTPSTPATERPACLEANGPARQLIMASAERSTAHVGRVLLSPLSKRRPLEIARHIREKASGEPGLSHCIYRRVIIADILSTKGESTNDRYLYRRD